MTPEVAMLIPVSPTTKADILMAEEKQYFYVLTHEYSDRSAFTICGLTQNLTVAKAWVMAGDENKCYLVPLDQIALWDSGFPSSVNVKESLKNG